MHWGHCIFCICFLVCCVSASTVWAADWTINGTAEYINSDTTIAGSIFIENGGSLTISNATLTLSLTYDEQYWIELAGKATLTVNNGKITSTGGQYWIEMYSDGTFQPSLNVSGSSSWITNHSGIRPYDASKITVTGGDVEELQVHDQVVAKVTDAATYPVLFFDGRTATLNNLNVGLHITNTLSVPGGWRFEFSNAFVEGYQIDLLNSSQVTVNTGYGIVLSIHTPGNLQGLQIVDGITETASGSVTNLGPTFIYNNCDVALVNVYTNGSDEVLLRNMHINEVNANGTSRLTIGQIGYTTRLNCNLCQVYDRATLTVESSIIDDSDNVPSATSSYHNDPYLIGEGTMIFSNSDLRPLYLTAREAGTISLNNCQWDPAKVSIIGSTAHIYYNNTVPLLSGAGLCILLLCLSLLMTGIFHTTSHSTHPQ